ILAEIARQGGAAIGRKLDAAVFFGDDKPVSWTSNDLLAAAVAAGQTITVSSAENDLAGAIFQAAGFVDEAGFEPTTVAAPRGLRYRLPNLRDNTAAPIFLPSLSTTPGAVDSIAGREAAWVAGRVWDRDEAEAIVVDRDRVVIGVR